MAHQKRANRWPKRIQKWWNSSTKWWPNFRKMGLQMNSSQKSKNYMKRLSLSKRVWKFRVSSRSRTIWHQIERRLRQTQIGNVEQSKIPEKIPNQNIKIRLMRKTTHRIQSLKSCQKISTIRLSPKDGKMENYSFSPRKSPDAIFRVCNYNIISARINVIYCTIFSYVW